MFTKLWLKIFDIVEMFSDYNYKMVLLFDTMFYYVIEKDERNHLYFMVKAD